jgi:phosphopantetheine--protein transferase-like protein
VGVDHVTTADLASSLETFGDRFATRVFTPGELAAAEGFVPAERLRHLAGRFAAKEAVAKALDHPGSRALPWTDIEVRTTSTGRPEVLLHGGAALWSNRSGVSTLDVSISHDHHTAIAVALTLPTPSAPVDPDPLVDAGSMAAPDTPHHHKESPMTTAPTSDARIRAVLDAHARLSTPVADLQPTSDLYAAGMTSHASVNVMLALEDEFDVEFPDALLRRDTFSSIAQIEQAISTLDA